MMTCSIRNASFAALLSFTAGVVCSPAAAASIDIAQQPLFTTTSQPPLNMLVMGRDQKIYNAAYNDTSDLNGDGALDIGYKPTVITYYGYFNSDVCYAWAAGTDQFVPSSAATNKQCSGSWSGDFLNYLTTSRMDALRRVLYGGWRQVDSATDTVLQGAYFPQDGHSWGKEYQGIARDGYDITKYAPLSLPDVGRYILFAVTTLKGNANAYPGYQAPILRVLRNTDKRVWNWLSIEGPVAGNKCFTSSNSRVDCVAAGGTSWQVVPAEMFQGLFVTTWKRTSGAGNPASRAEMDLLFTLNAGTGNLCGTGSVSVIDRPSGNPFSGSNGCTDDNFLTRLEGTLIIPAAGTYTFGVDGDDAVDLSIDGIQRIGWYGGHGNDRSDGGLTSHSVALSLSAGAHTITFRHQEAAGGENWGLLQKQTTGATTLDDYSVRVQSCPSGASNAALRESSCKKYPNDEFKPTGILHDYGESARMYFGLITGSQFNNIEGGVLRRNVSNFANEIDAGTGQFKTTVNGIANTISELRMIGAGYNGGITDNSSGDTNWNWNNNNGNCPTPDNSAPLNNGDCRMWGNPLAEMLYESLRYFAGAAGPTARFATGGNANGKAEETTMTLPSPAWVDPYKPVASGGGGFLACAKPYQTIISDINPSYDGDLPGSAFTGAITTTSTTPAAIAGFNASAQGQLIWDAEFGAGSRSVFIGDVNNFTDGAPTAKLASSFGNIRGLAPEEPTKGGTYYSASVSRFGRNTDISAAAGQQNLSTYAIALASPLPRIVFPVGGGTVTMVPFAKTASGTFGQGPRKPTNQIVAFYVEKIVNLPYQPLDTTINGGRPYAVFRISYEDSEQGNDYDMDAIVRYLVQANVDGTVTVTLTSEYAAGSADQNMGYVVSGTTEDGIYLEVRDTDSGAGSYTPYALNTPNPVLPGGCSATIPPLACASQLPTSSTRVFTPTAATAGSGSIFLNDPLWYAAKYGSPNSNSDVDGDGTPDNYFLVTNPANLKTQLDKAFTDIITSSQPTASVATSTPRFVNGVTLAYEASFKATDWSGDLTAYNIRADGVYTGTTPVWKASDKLPNPAARTIFTSASQTAAFTGLGVAFTKTDLPAAMQTSLMAGLDTDIYTIDDVLAYLRGDQSKEVSQSPPGPYRTRSTRIGDVLNSSPAVIGVTSYGYGQILQNVDAAASSAYAAFVQGKKSVFGSKSENPVIFFGSNDGMLHAVDGSNNSTAGGKELFAYVPNAAVPNLNALVKPSYTHRYFVDGSPTVSDAYVGGGWKTVLLSSTGAGSRSVFALDVTNPASFGAANVMWEFNSGSADVDSGLLGQSIGRPWIGRADDGNWVAVFGNGYNSDGDEAALFIRKLADGTKDATILIPTPAICSTSPNSDGCGPNGLGMAVLVDNDGSGAGDTIYAGDYLGNMWRFEYVGGIWSLGNGGKPLFVARDINGKRQSITSGAYTVANALGGTMVIFGTGRYLDVNDADEKQINVGTRDAVDTIYGILDSRSCTTLSSTSHVCTTWSSTESIAGRADLQKQSINGYTPLSGTTGGYRTATRNSVNYRTGGGDKMGWFLDLSFEQGTGADKVDLLSGERVVVRPDGILTDVVINTIRPRGDSCEPGVQNATMVLDALTGAADYIPVPPPGGWPTGTAPPAGAAGTDTYSGPPQGEPPIMIARPPIGGVPCLPGAPGCVPEIPETGVPTSCSWTSPNSTGHPPGKPMPCGRISWKQLR